MKNKTAGPTQLDIIGDRDRFSTREVLTALVKQCRQKLGYFSIFAAVPAMMGSHASEARANDERKPQANVAGREVKRFAGLNRTCSSPELLKRQSEFRLPHQKGNFSMAAAAVAGNDNCPGRSIPAGSYTAAAPYLDSGDTTGANNTVTVPQDYFYCYYSYNAFGPDHVYSFTLTGRGANPRIEVSTTSGSYTPLIYVLQGGLSGACPVGTGTSPCSLFVISFNTPPGGTAILNKPQMDYLPLNVPLHLFVDSPLNSSGPYSLKIQDVTIAQPDCPNNPIDCPEYFITRHYVDFLNRYPDPPGFASWQALLAGCAPGDTTCDRIHISSTFFRSPEFQGRGYFIYRFFPVAFGRKPDYDEFVGNMWQVSGFLTDAELELRKQQFIGHLMNRADFVATYNGLTNTQYVDKLLANADITHPARNVWIAALGNGTRTRGQVLREIAESSEVYNKYYNQAFVVMQYFGYLRRQPDALYLNWLALLEATGDYRSMTIGFVNSLEYRNRFTP